MNSIVLYCKSYRGDANRAKVLLESVVRHNRDNIPFYISVPRGDVEVFRQTLGTTGYTLVEDESFYDHRSGESWHTQQIVKSSFWKTGVCHNYVMIDSDSYFIRPFFVTDFIVEDTTPYTVMHEQKDLFAWSCNKEALLGFNPYNSFVADRAKVMNVFGRKGRCYDFGPGPIVWSATVWRSLEENYLVPNSLTLASLIKEVPSEFSWYGEYLLASRAIEIWPVEPLFKFFHYSRQYEEFKSLNYQEKDFAQNYLGVVMQSNWGAPLKY